MNSKIVYPSDVELNAAIVDVLERKLFTANVNLPVELKENMVISLGDFIRDSLDKYIAGQKEHGGDLRDRNLDEEIRKEQIDMFWYSEAKKWKGEKNNKYEHIH